MREVTLHCIWATRPVFCCNNGFFGKSLQGPPPAPGPCRFILRIAKHSVENDRGSHGASHGMTRPVMAALWGPYFSLRSPGIAGGSGQHWTPDTWSLTSQGNEAATNDDGELHCGLIIIPRHPNTASIQLASLETVEWRYQDYINTLIYLPLLIYKYVPRARDNYGQRRLNQVNFPDWIQTFPSEFADHYQCPAPSEYLILHLAELNSDYIPPPCDLLFVLQGPIICSVIDPAERRQPP